MRAARAKSLRREHPDRPNPGRKSGGSAGLEATYLASERRRRERALQVIENLKKQKEQADG